MDSEKKQVWLTVQSMLRAADELDWKVDEEATTDLELTYNAMFEEVNNLQGDARMNDHLAMELDEEAACQQSKEHGPCVDEVSTNHPKHEGQEPSQATAEIADPSDCEESGWSNLLKTAITSVQVLKIEFEDHRRAVNEFQERQELQHKDLTRRITRAKQTLQKQSRSKDEYDEPEKYKNDLESSSNPILPTKPNPIKVNFGNDDRFHQETGLERVDRATRISTPEFKKFSVADIWPD